MYGYIYRERERGRYHSAPFSPVSRFAGAVAGLGVQCHIWLIDLISVCVLCAYGLFGLSIWLVWLFTGFISSCVFVCLCGDVLFGLLFDCCMRFPGSSVICLRGGEGTLDWDTVASHCSTGNCLSNFNKKISSKKLELISLSSTRVSNRSIPPSDCSLCSWHSALADPKL